MPQPSEFDPAGILADRAAVARADDAGSGQLGAGFGEWEVARTESRVRTPGRKLRQEGVQRAFQVGHADAFVNVETFDLVKHRRVRGIERVRAVTAAGRDNPHRRLPGFHSPDLDRRSVAAETSRPRQIEPGPGVARRVVGFEVQGREVVPVVLDVRPQFLLETPSARRCPTISSRHWVIRCCVPSQCLRPGRRHIEFDRVALICRLTPARPGADSSSVVISFLTRLAN